MTNMQPVHLSRDAAPNVTWAELVVQIQQAFTWNPTTEVVSYLESVQRCGFERVALQAVSIREDAFEGRLFAADAEVRWVRGEDGHLDAWLLRERVPDDSHEANASREDRRYYLVGRGLEVPGSYQEARYPGCTFAYPIALDAVASRAQPEESDNVRPYVLVAEYGRLKPDWKGSADEISSELDAPLLIAHRFVCLAESDGEED